MFLWSLLARQIRRWQGYYRTVSELSELDDRRLVDINVPRGEIRNVARRTARLAA